MALDMFDKYLQYDDWNDIDGNLYKIYCHLWLGQYLEAEDLITYLEGIHIDNKELFKAKGELFCYTKSFDEIVNYYESGNNIFSDDIDMLMLLGNFYYNNRG